jgi:hypothetical protein
MNAMTRAATTALRNSLDGIEKTPLKFVTGFCQRAAGLGLRIATSWGWPAGLQSKY